MPLKICPNCHRGCNEENEYCPTCKTKLPDNNNSNKADNSKFPGSTKTPKPGRFRRGYELLKISVKLLEENPAIFVLSFFISLIELINLYFINPPTGIGALFMSSSMIVKGSVSWAVLFFPSFFLFDLVNTFIVAILFTIISLQIKGQNPTIYDGLSNALLYIQPLVLWVFLITIVYTIRIAALAWFPNGIQEALLLIIFLLISLLTFFVVPIFLFEEKSIPDAIVDSAERVQAYWREIIGAIGSLVVIVIFLLVGIATVIIGIFLLESVVTGSIHTVNEATASINLAIQMVAYVLILVFLMTEYILHMYLYIYTGEERLNNSKTEG
jgi:hypothetical protein